MLQTALKFIEALNNRELAALVWILIAVILCLSIPKVRASLFHLIRAFFAWKLSISYILMFLYIAFLIWILNAISIWQKDHIPLTIVWCACSAFVMFFGFQKANDQSFFKNSIKDHVKGLVFLEFFVNLYVFNFWIEFASIPILAFAGGMKVIAERTKEHETVDKFLNSIFILVGSFYIIHSVYMVVTDFENFATLKNFQNFYIPILLSLLFIPFVYTAALIAAYESFFTRLQFFVPERSVRTYAKIKTFLTIKLNLWKLNKWSVYVISNWRFKDKKEVRDAVIGFKQSLNL